MKIVRVLKGKMYFDEFNETVLDSSWESIPLDNSRYNLTEMLGVLKLFSSSTDFMLLRNEDTNYVIDITNTYLPSNIFDRAGLIVFRDSESYTEFLEYYDITLNESFVYNFMRIQRVGNILMFYAKNTDVSNWELIGTTSSNELGKVGLIIKGSVGSSQQAFSVESFKMYKSTTVKILNVNPGYVVQLFTESNILHSSRKVIYKQQGAVFNITDIPPYSFYFKILTADYQIVHTSKLFTDMCGGDIYYYGAMPDVLYNGINLLNDNEFFLGYFQNSVINFNLNVINSWEEMFVNTRISTRQYNTDTSYQLVKFSIDGVTYENSLLLGDLGPESNTVVHVRIERNVEILPEDVEPSKFHIHLTFD